MKGQIEQTLTSVEVAEMVGKDHKNLLADIRGYIDELSQLKIQPSDFFWENTYLNRGKSYPCYDVTKKGCEFISHKLNGIKGTEFTARYINRFHDMEEQIAGPFEGLSTELKAVIVVDKRVTAVEMRVDNVRKELEDFKQELPMFGVDEDMITTAVHRKGVAVLGGKKTNAYKDKTICGKVYQDIYREIRRQFGIRGTYKQLKRNQCETVVKIIEAYEPPFILAEQIKDCNAQLHIEVAQ